MKTSFIHLSFFLSSFNSFERTFRTVSDRILEIINSDNKEKLAPCHLIIREEILKGQSPGNRSLEDGTFNWSANCDDEAGRRCMDNEHTRQGIQLSRDTPRICLFIRELEFLAILMLLLPLDRQIAFQCDSDDRTEILILFFTISLTLEKITRHSSLSFWKN